MKALAKLTLCLSTILCCFVPPAFAFNSGSTGTEDLIVTTNTTLALPEDGVLQYKDVHVQSGVTLRFGKNAKNTPVTILASGDVTIEGTINVSGSNGNYIIPGEGGPGGFDGGVGAAVGQVGRRGEGPGGGLGGNPNPNDPGGCGGGGSFASTGGTGGRYTTSYPGGAGGSTYGNERILPLVGGSGGAGGGSGRSYVGGAGGGGGGAILIASSGAINVVGTISASGGNGANGEGGSGSYFYGAGGGGGSGGSIRLIANSIGGNGTITAAGGTGGWGWNVRGGAGGVGRIRFEASTISRTSATSPPLSMGYPYAVIPPDMPSLRISSIAGMSVPEIPRGDFGAPDVILPYNAHNPVTVIVQGTNIPTGTQVTIKSNPAVGSTVSGSSSLTGTLESSAASIDLNISTAYPSVVTAYVTYQLTAANRGPFYIDGEKVEMVRVASTLGENSQVTYITESGREIPATM